LSRIVSSWKFSSEKWFKKSSVLGKNCALKPGGKNRASAGISGPLDGVFHQRPRYFAVHIRRSLPALQNVGQNKGQRPPAGLLPGELQRDAQGSVVVVIRVVDEGAAVDACFQLQTHGHGFELQHPFGDLRLWDAEAVGQSPAVDGVFDGCGVGKGNYQGRG
jgi:hypothetical protein